MQDPLSLPVPVLSLQRAIVLGALLILFDAFMLNQGGIAVLAALYLLFIHLPRTFLVKKYVTVRRERLRNIAVYFAAVILVFALNAANNRMAQTRSEALITAIKAFHTQHQRYPKSLEELVPQFIDRIPLAKYTLVFNRFEYSASDSLAKFGLGFKISDDLVSLGYYESPPFGRWVYSFSRNEWRYFD